MGATVVARCRVTMPDRIAGLTWPWTCLCLAVTILAVAGGRSAAGQPVSPATTGRVIDLAGEWRFLLDAQDRGVADKVWQTRLPDRIRLPGSTDTGRYATGSRSIPVRSLRSRVFPYVGPAWYQRDIAVPYAWRRRRVTLFLERCHWETRVWLDGRFVGSQNSLSTPHVYDLTNMATPGTHRLTIRVDNRLELDLGELCNAVSEETQTNWNGIVGRIELHGTARVWIEEVQNLPSVPSKSITVRTRIGNLTGRRVSVKLLHTANARSSMAAVVTRTAGNVGQGFAWVTCTLPLGANARFWSTDDPEVYTVRTDLEATDGRTTWVHSCETPTALRSFRAENGRFLLNDFPILLRGAVDRAVFPRSGYPPTSAAAWRKFFTKAKQYGLNHVRFETWCPPAAAFEAADATGMLLLVEAPFHGAGLGQVPARDRFLHDETLRIVRNYGNHPSFALFTLGAVLGGNATYAETILHELKAADPRHLYAASTAGIPSAADDFAVVPVPVRPDSHETSADMHRSSEVSLPVIAHEVGLRGGFPDIGVLAKHAGVLRATGLVRLQDSLGKRGLADKAATMARSAACTDWEFCRASVERLLATGALAGYHLAGFVGGLSWMQGGMGALDIFWDETGIVTPEEMRQWCSDMVPLLVGARHRYSTTETFEAEVALCHFAAQALEQIPVSWSLRSGDAVVAEGSFQLPRIERGTVTRVGRIVVPLSHVKPPARLGLIVSVNGTGAKAEWPLWVYSSEDEGAFAEGVYVATRLNTRALETLRAGGRVVLLAETSSIRWSVPSSLAFGGNMADQGMVGVVCDPRYPALRGFPTRDWAEPQWYDLLSRSRAIVLPVGVPASVCVVEGIDRPTRNLPLALLMECRVLGGRLLACSLDLVSEIGVRHEARQLLKSLLDYAASEFFVPAQEISQEDLARLFRLGDSDDTITARSPDPSQASLWVRAGGLATGDAMAEWSPETDIVVTRKEGFSYTVRAAVTARGSSSGWSDADEVRIALEIPAGQQGKLYLKVSGERNVVQIVAGDGPSETVLLPDGGATWVMLHIGSADDKPEECVISLQPEKGKVQVHEMLFVPDVRSTPTAGKR